jgi:hypothetical protein
MAPAGSAIETPDFNDADSKILSLALIIHPPKFFSISGRKLSSHLIDGGDERSAALCSCHCSPPLF